MILSFHGKNDAVSPCLSFKELKILNNNNNMPVDKIFSPCHFIKEFFFIDVVYK